jgi:hypothetical protein
MTTGDSWRVKAASDIKEEKSFLTTDERNHSVVHCPGAYGRYPMAIQIMKVIFQQIPPPPPPPKATEPSLGDPGLSLEAAAANKKFLTLI